MPVSPWSAAFIVDPDPRIVAVHHGVAAKADGRIGVSYTDASGRSEQLYLALLACDDPVFACGGGDSLSLPGYGKLTGLVNDLVIF